MIVDTREITKAEAERLVKLCQECAEVVVACTKALMYGWAPAHAGIQYNNRADIEEELGDVGNVQQLMAAKGDLSNHAVTAYGSVKFDRMLNHMRYQHEPAPAPWPAVQEDEEPELVTEFF